MVDSNFDTADGPVNLIPDAVNDENLHTQYSRPSGGQISSSAVSMIVLVDDSPTGPACLVTGHFMRSGG